MKFIPALKMPSGLGKSRGAMRPLLRLAASTALAVGATAFAGAPGAYAQNASNADAVYSGYLSAFLVQNGNTAYFVNGTSDRSMAFMWGQAYMITGVEDAYDRFPSSDKATLITNLLNTFMANNATNGNGSDWSWDSWNDDVVWAEVAFVRGYLITHNTTFLNAAEQNFNMVWNRGWDTSLGGGIWENQDKQTKATLSNDPAVMVGCMIYDITGDSGYLSKAEQIYSWEWNHLFDHGTGQVNEAITSSGSEQYSDNVYNSGTFVNAANALYKETAGGTYYNDAKLAADHIVNEYSVLSSTGGSAWADQFVRGLAKFARQNNLWSTYGPWLTNQCTAAWNNRRTDYNITNNNWTSPTPSNTQAYAMDSLSAMVAQMVQQTDVRSGVHTLINQANGLAVDNAASTTQNTGILQWQWNGGRQQQWYFLQNSDTSWNIINMLSGQLIDDPGGNTTNGTQMVQWPQNSGTNQHWWVDQQSDGSYKIWNVASGLALDDDAKTANGTPLIEWTWQGNSNQKWYLK